MFNGINLLTPEDKKKAQDNIKETEKVLESNPMVKAQALIAAEEWVKGNKTAQKMKKSNPLLYNAYFTSVVVERAAVILGII